MAGTKNKKEEFIKDITGEDFQIKVYSFDENLPKYVEMIGYFRWYPDLFLDMIRPPVGGINLHLDQRVFLRSEMRFQSMYGVFSRSYAKTFNQVLVLVLTAIFYPGMTLSVTAQTKANASKILHDKWREIERYYPMLKNELITKPKFSKDEAQICFLNGSVIDILANSQTSKGQRRHVISIEESALMDNNMYNDALAPIVDNPRRTVGKYAIANPQELHRQINFFTTSWYRASYEYTRMRKMVQDMIDLQGVIVLGSSWQLPAWYGRGSDKATIKKKRDAENPVTFDMNYCSRWVGVTDGALVDIQRLLELRTLEDPCFENEDGGEYYMSVDVARAEEGSTNAQTSIAVGRVHRNDNSTIKKIQLVNLFTISGTKTFSYQAREIKRYFKLFRCQALIIDSNGIGKGLCDELLLDDEEFGTMSTMNSDVDGQDPNAPKCIYDLKVTGSTSANSDIIVTFMGLVSSGKLELLVSKEGTDITEKDIYLLPQEKVPFIQTDFLIQEISNLQLTTLSNNRIGVRTVISRLGKDRYSSLIYLLWYITTFEAGNKVSLDDGQNFLGFATMF